MPISPNGALVVIDVQNEYVTGRMRIEYPPVATSLANIGRAMDTARAAGYMTHNCDDATIRQAVHAGLAVEFLHDAAGSVPYANRAGRATAEEIHRAFLVVLQSRFAAVLSTEEWIDAVRTGIAPPRETIFGSYQRAHQGGA